MWNGLRHLPNLICILRILLILPIVTALDDGRFAMALVLFVIAAVSDGIDGFLAKHFRWTSDIGRFLDPLADKLLLVAVFLAASWAAIVPWWLAAAVIGRDVMIGVGALIFRVWFGPLQGKPTLISKFNTLMQILVLCAAIVVAAWTALPREIVAALAVATFVTTVASGADYLRQFVHRAWVLPVRRR